MRVLHQSGARLGQSFGDRHFDVLIARGCQQCGDGLGANLDRRRAFEGGEQPRPQRRARLRGVRQRLRGLAIGARKIFAADDVERRGPLGGGDAELGRCRRVVSEHEQQLGLGLGGEAGGRALGAEGEKQIVDDANLLGAGRRRRCGLAQAGDRGRGQPHLRAAVTRKLKRKLRSRQVAPRRGTIDRHEQRLLARRPAEANLARIVLAPGAKSASA